MPYSELGNCEWGDQCEVLCAPERTAQRESRKNCEFFYKKLRKEINGNFLVLNFLVCVGSHEFRVIRIFFAILQNLYHRDYTVSACPKCFSGHKCQVSLTRGSFASCGNELVPPILPIHQILFQERLYYAFWNGGFISLRITATTRATLFLHIFYELFCTTHFFPRSAFEMFTYKNYILNFSTNGCFFNLFFFNFIQQLDVTFDFDHFFQPLFIKKFKKWSCPKRRRMICNLRSGNLA